MLKRILLALALCAAVSGCASVSNPHPTSPAGQNPIEAPARQTLPSQQEEALANPREQAIVVPPQVPLQLRTFELQEWSALPDWNTDNLAEALPAFVLSCNALKTTQELAAPCAAASQIRPGDPQAARAFFESYFAPWQVRNAEGATEGLVTGYYEPLLQGSRVFGGTYRFPIYAPPDDLLAIDLSDTNPGLKGIRLRGRLQNKKIVPYYTRAEIDNGLASLRGREIIWVDDPVELFFLHVQGSGRIKLPDGKTIRVGFADHNGHPYVSVGKILVERGELTVDKASMQGIKDWAVRHPDKLAALLQQNPAYVFFRELPESGLGPIGAQGVPLTPGRSIAVDAMTTALGTPVFLSTTFPLTTLALNRLVIAQDTGSAIKGAVRADLFWGFGAEAGRSAGRMRQSGKMWVLYPRGVQPKLQ